MNEMDVQNISTVVEKENLQIKNLFFLGLITSIKLINIYFVNSLGNQNQSCQLGKISQLYLTTRRLHHNYPLCVYD